MPRCIICNRPTESTVRIRFITTGPADVALCIDHRSIMDIEDLNGDRAEPTQGTNMQASAPSPMGRADQAETRPPFLGEGVMYRSRTGDYWLAAVVSRTCRSSSPEALHRAVTRAGLLFMEPLTLLQVDLTVFSPGGCHVDGQPNEWTGTYAEHHISWDPNGAPGTWCRFEDLLAAGKEIP